MVKVVTDEDEGYSELRVTTTDRPGLLTDIVHSLKDVSVNVISAEVCPVWVSCFPFLDLDAYHSALELPSSGSSHPLIAIEVLQNCQLGWPLLLSSHSMAGSCICVAQCPACRAMLHCMTGLAYAVARGWQAVFRPWSLSLVSCTAVSCC